MSRAFPPTHRRAINRSETRSAVTTRWNLTSSGMEGLASGLALFGAPMSAWSAPRPLRLRRDRIDNESATYGISVARYVSRLCLRSGRRPSAGLETILTGLTLADYKINCFGSPSLLAVGFVSSQSYESMRTPDSTCLNVLICSLAAENGCFYSSDLRKESS